MSDYERPDQSPEIPTSAPPPVPEQTPPPAPAEPAPAAPEDWPLTEPPARWVGFVTSLGLALAVVVTAQVLAAIAEGFALKPTEPQGLPGDVFHRLGYAFSNLGGIVLLFLVLAVVLVSLPTFMDERTSDRQESAAAITLGLTVVLSIIIGVGAILAVRYNLHLYSAAKRPVPSYVRIQLVFFLLGALGTAAVALFGALTALGLRDRAGRGSDGSGASSSPDPDAADAS